MKNLIFLFDHIQIFYLIGVLVVINTILGITLSLMEKTFSWGQTTDGLRLIGIYIVWLMLGNAMEYFTKVQGYELALVGIDITGFGVAASWIAGKEIGKIVYKLKKLMPKDEQEKQFTSDI